MASEEHDTKKTKSHSVLPDHNNLTRYKPLDFSHHFTKDPSSAEPGLCQKESPEPSCVSMKNDLSMPNPIHFSVGDSSADLSQKWDGSDSYNGKKLESIFKEAEHKIISVMKKELNSFKKLLIPNLPECSETEEEDDKSYSKVRKAVLKITLHILKKMNLTDLADTLHHINDITKHFVVSLTLVYVKRYAYRPLAEKVLRPSV